MTIIGYTDLASRLAKQSSTLYATNLLRLTEELCKTKDGVINVNMEDEAIRGLTVIKDGAITWPPPPPKLPAVAPQAKPAAMPAAAPRRGTATAQASRCPASRWRSCSASARSLFLLVGAYAPASVPGALHGVRAGLLRRLHGGLERDAGAAHAADERDQRDPRIIAIGALVQVAPPLAGGGADRPTTC